MAVNEITRESTPAAMECGHGNLEFFLDAMIVVARRIWLVLGVTAGAGIAAIVVALLLPKQYTATAKIMPPQKNTSQMNLLAQQLGPLAGLAGSDLGLRNPDDLYVSMMRTRVVQDQIIKQFGLQEIYGLGLLTQVRERLDQMTQIETGKDGLISISVSDRDPRRAAGMANAYVDGLSRVTAFLAESEATRRKEYFKRQRDLTEKDLEDAEQAFKEVEQQTGVLHLDTQARVVIEALANARAEVAAREIELHDLSNRLTPQNPDLIKAEEHLASLRAQVANMERTQGGHAGSNRDDSGLAESGLEYTRRLRQVKYEESLSDLVAKQFEAARMDESRNSVVIQTLDPAIPPEIRSSPKRTLIVVGAVLLAFFGTICAIFVFEAGHQLSQTPEIAARVALLKQYLFHKPNAG